MGRATIEDMLDYADEEFALHWHLTANHYPRFTPASCRLHSR